MVSHIKKTRGRQKLPMEKIEKDGNRLVTFSKRRAGLFKKASELCTLTGAHIGIVVFSPAQKLYSFGHPSLSTITDRFIYENSTHANLLQYQAPNEIQQESIIRSNIKLTCLKDQLDIEMKQSNEILAERMSNSEEVLKFLAPVENLTLEELTEMHATLTRLRDTVRNHEQRMNEAYSDVNPNPNPNSILTITYPPSMVLEQNYNPNPQTFGGPSQIRMTRGPYDNPPIVMIPTPTQSMAMRPRGIGQPHDGFLNPNMVQPFRGTTTPIPIQGQFDRHPFQEITAPLLIQGQFDRHQIMPAANMGMNSMLGTYQGFTSFLLGDGNETSQAPFNPQGEFPFGPGPN